MYYNKVEICGINTSELATLSDEEKKELLEKARQGDGDARKKLIDGNLRLVLSIIQRFSKKREDADDLFQVGCIGLIKAVDNFDTTLDVKFSTYAVPMIIGELRRYMRDNNAIRVSRSTRDLAYRALQAREQLSKISQNEPTIEEILAKLNADGVDTDKERLVNALEGIADPVSLFEPVYSDNGGNESLYIMDQIRDKDSNDEVWLERIALNDAMKELAEREKNIISMRFFSGKTQMEIADEIGISQAQVSRLEKSALEKIKKQMQPK
ncbi:MAG: RNA polymerase sporulation sigma factor SigG [Clostridia bacterium]|nr:RNA polymerase sporulation sigma factor SigG [Clostridia bacterium]